ncbi:histidinol-phosphate aminotransferase family protein, partial [Streptomyces scabiei]|nr:histidinol-phosphate aminotransferase family protein [Streptomyces scabiei]MDX3212185.1 histidinol-phosphate aminotransferase family protein [Streptomyces scabiei]
PAPVAPMQFPAPAPAPAPMPMPMPVPAPAPMPAAPAAAMPVPGLQPVAQTGMPGLATAAQNRRTMGAAQGLTAAQVRGRTQPEPLEEPLGWPAAGGVYNQVG